MEKREKALAELRKLIAEQRARIDPKILAMAEKAAGAASPESGRKNTAVPYDRAAAAEIIRIFLKQHTDPTGTEKKLLELLRKTTH